ncbi:hypothetical protein [Rhodococcus sp. 05-2255-3B1]|uniref:hypothetical protein n=1 Tax=Rhodococcus sp. 05-2255-3B1 TaxID=2022482 RepID=UPI0015C636D3|nr:hypothetical protein [Rhodococcus sp. 05-2255-3B1]
MSGSLMPDVRGECGCADAPNVPEWTEVPIENLSTPKYRGRTVDCGTGEHFTFTGLTYDPDETGDRFTVHGRNGKWSTSATLRSGDVVRVQAKGAGA